nr:hypothetical protein [Microbacterium bovistercoris]
MIVVASNPVLNDDEWQQSVTANPGGFELRVGGSDEKYVPITNGALVDDPFRPINLVRNGADLSLILARRGGG